jgi:hypothetical protein
MILYKKQRFSLHMRRSAIVFLVLGTVFATPAAAEVMFVCANPDAPKASSSRSAQAMGVLELQPVSASPRSKMQGEQIALWRGDDGFDLILNWNRRDEISLKKTGVAIVGNAVGDGFVHLLVSYTEDTPVEHLIFTAEHDGLGKLTWVTALSDDAEASENAIRDTSTVCVTP